MIGYPIRQEPQKPRPTRLYPTLAQRNRAIVEHFAAGERYAHLARTFGVSLHGVIRVVHRYARKAAPEQYWPLLQAQGHRLSLPHAVLREHIQHLLAREEEA
jgi:transposase